MSIDTEKLFLRELSPRQYPWELLLLADPSEAQIQKYIDTSFVRGFIEEGCVIAVVVLTPICEAVIEIKNIAVAPEYQGQGIGKHLLNEALLFCRQQHFAHVEIGTGNSSSHQLALYQKAGFRIIETDYGFFTRNYPEPIVENGILCTDMIRLRKDLTGIAEQRRSE